MVKRISWRSLNAKIPNLSEAEVLVLLDEEMATHKRLVIARRLHQRYSALRTIRERAEILSKVNP